MSNNYKLFPYPRVNFEMLMAEMTNIFSLQGGNYRVCQIQTSIPLLMLF